LQKSHEVLRVPTVPNNARYLELVLFILGSWLAKVVDVIIFLDSRFSRNLLAVGGEVAVLLSHWCWLRKCSFVSLLVSHHMIVRYSEGLLKCSLGGIFAWQTYQILVKQLTTWSLATAKVRVQGGTKSIPWQIFWCQPKTKYLSTLFFLCSWQGL
jgi:hypothetical protein